MIRLPLKRFEVTSLGQIHNAGKNRFNVRSIISVLSECSRLMNSESKSKIEHADVLLFMAWNFPSITLFMSLRNSLEESHDLGRMHEISRESFLWKRIHSLTAPRQLVTEHQPDDGDRDWASVYRALYSVAQLCKVLCPYSFHKVGSLDRGKERNLILRTCVRVYGYVVRCVRSNRSSYVELSYGILNNALVHLLVGSSC